MDVFRHDYVADEAKSESRAHLVQNCDKAISCPRRAKQWPPAIAAKGDEVKVPASVVASQRIAHEKNRTLETEGCGTQTSKPDVAECYASPGSKRKSPSMRYPPIGSYMRKPAPLKSPLRSSVQALRGSG